MLRRRLSQQQRTLKTDERTKDKKSHAGFLQALRLLCKASPMPAGSRMP
jgi:hypothetical protein